MIDRILKLELFSDGTVATSCEIRGETTSEQEQSENAQAPGQDFLKESVHVNSKGETVLIRLTELAENAQADDKPKVKFLQGNLKTGALSTLTVPVADYDPEFYYTGDCICWKMRE